MVQRISFSYISLVCDFEQLKLYTFYFFAGSNSYEFHMYMNIEIFTHVLLSTHSDYMMHETIAKFGEREQNQKNSPERTPH